MSHSTVIRMSIFMFVMLLLGCGADAPQNASNDRGPRGGQQGRQRPAPKAVPIAVTKVIVGEAASLYTTTATLEAEAHAQVLARTSGVVRRILHEEGDEIREGAVLLELEDETQKLELKQAVLRRESLTAQYNRQKKMQAQGIVSPQQFEDIENSYNQAVASVEQAELALSYTKIRAPFSGRMVRRLVDLGAHVQSGTPLFEMMDVTPLLARVHVPSNRMGGISEGQSLRMVLDSNATELQARIRLVSPIVDPNTGTVKVTAEIPNYPAGTRPGDFAEVSIVTERRDNAMLVPSEAVFEEQGRNVLYVAADGKADRREVTVGFVEQGSTEVRAGIDPDDLVVIKG
ncbi:MAG: efflux RND transporter periplasmic adaptor subunit, partial [Acidobacteriota bacterium]|nr:efflux RND transporter periplasmic adaptor subunit [Acidobacteriota bacterium]